MISRTTVLEFRENNRRTVRLIMVGPRCRSCSALEYPAPAEQCGGPDRRTVTTCVTNPATVPMINRWLGALPATVVPALGVAAGGDLLRRWREPHRRYHTVEHLSAVLDVIDDHSGVAAEAGVVRLAAWFHDAVYDPRAADNEQRSALLAVDVLGRLAVAPGKIAEVARLVRLTATHVPQPGDANGALLVDADLAILAAAPDRYDRYTEQVRREYRHVDDLAFIAGRTALLQRLIGDSVLYRILPDRDAMRTRARRNMQRELDRLHPPL